MNAYLPGKMRVLETARASRRPRNRSVDRADAEAAFRTIIGWTGDDHSCRCKKMRSLFPIDRNRLDIDLTVTEATDVLFGVGQQEDDFGQHDRYSTGLTGQLSFHCCWLAVSPGTRRACVS